MTNEKPTQEHIYARSFVNNLAGFFTGGMEKCVQEALFEVLRDKLDEIQPRKPERPLNHHVDELTGKDTRR